MGAAVTAGVSLVVATISGGFGHHLGAAVLVGLLHTTGPIAFLIGGLGGLGLAAMSWYVGREQLAQRMKGVALPRSVARIVLREGSLSRLAAQGREQCRDAVRQRLERELGAARAAARGTDLGEAASGTPGRSARTELRIHRRRSDG